MMIPVYFEHRLNYMTIHGDEIHYTYCITSWHTFHDGTMNDMSHWLQVMTAELGGVITTMST